MRKNEEEEDQEKEEEEEVRGENLIGAGIVRSSVCTYVRSHVCVLSVLVQTSLCLFHSITISLQLLACQLRSSRVIWFLDLHYFTGPSKLRLSLSLQCVFLRSLMLKPPQCFDRGFVFLAEKKQFFQMGYFGMLDFQRKSDDCQRLRNLFFIPPQNPAKLHQSYVVKADAYS